ncbi:MAG TPA: EAL domain-containing protein [Burkholderiales bacterium]|nr:EAL domain-containing protein [Burkholderiales bacterium]
MDNPAGRWLKRRFGMNAVIVTFCLILVAITWGAVIAQARLDQQKAIDNAFKQNSNLAKAFEEQAIRTLKGIDSATRFLEREYARFGTNTDIAGYIENGIIEGKLFVNVAVSDERGDMVLSSHPFIPTNVADREHFRSHMLQDSGKLFIGRPVLARTTGASSIPMSRRINKPDGSFGGIVAALVDPHYFTDFYQQTDLGKHGMVDLVGLDGISRARRIGNIASVGIDMSKSSLLEEQAKNSIGNFVSTDGSEGIARYVSFRTLSGYPLVVAVGTSQDEVLAEALGQQSQYFWAALLVSVFIILFAALQMASAGRNKRAVAALAGSNAQFRATFEQAAVGIAHTSIDGRYLRVNEKFCSILGYSERELLERTFIDVSHPDDRPLSTGFRARLQGGDTKSLTTAREKRYVAKNGSTVWASISVSLVRRPDGEADYFVVMMQDITGRVMAEERFRATFEQAAVGIAHTEPEGRFLQVNQKLCEMLGYTRDELLGMSAIEVTHPEDRGIDAVRRAQLIAGELETYSVERRCVRKDGAVIWVNRTVSMVRDAAGAPLYFIRVMEDITGRKRLQQDLQHQAHHDGLTLLPNRELFYDRLAHALDQAQRRKWITGVMFVDLDGFKVINDTLGHGVGDELLQRVAASLTECVRAEDTVGRLGGDEFAIILSELAQQEDAGRVAQKIIDSLATPFQIDANEVFITASIGITTSPPDTSTADALISHADAAMYSAKKLGKNNFQFYTAAMNERSMEKLLLEKDLRRALMRYEFILHLQPKANLHTGQITGVEALLRWQRSDGRLVPPLEFIPVLEESGLIVPVGEWVLRAACEQISSWQEAGLTPVPIAVNLSAKQFHQQDIAAMVMRALLEFGVDPHLLELEITESAAMHDAKVTTATLHKLKALGVRIAIDDFGTGYSSLSYLKRFPIDSLKIDRSFVTELPGNQEDASIAQAVITMAHALRLKVVAEGVENEAQLEFLAAHTCDEMQGYYFSRPLPAELCTQFLREERRLTLRPVNND